MYLPLSYTFQSTLHNFSTIIEGNKGVIRTWIGEAIFKWGDSFTSFDKLQIFEPFLHVH